MNIREVNDDDIMKDWIRFREEDILCYLNDKDKKHKLFMDEISERILKNVPKKIRNLLGNNLISLIRIFWIILLIGMRSIIGMDL